MAHTLTPQTPNDPIPIRLNTGKEIATLEVRGGLFTNWTSVRVEQKVTEAFPVFQFEATEESPIPQTWDALQFVPGDIVRVYVGGVPAVFGYITERHVAYDGRNHAVRLIGCGDTVDLTNSMVPLEKLNGHDGQSWSALARDLMQHLGIGLKEMGAVDPTPFENIQVQPGETIMQTLERYAKMRNIVIGSDANGGLLAIGENPATPSGDLVEGGNILRANAVFRDQHVYKKIYALGQTTGGDSAYGDSQNKQIAYETGSSSRNRYMITIADIADTQHGLQRRAMMEKVFTEGSFLDAQITVQGWFKDQNQSSEVWKAGEYYTVTSPSLILNGFVLGCSGCVYEQNEQGTTTTLSMVNPIHMNGLFNFRDAVQLTMAKQRADAAAKAAADIAAKKAADAQGTAATNAPVLKN
jgi:prophage tail gpP-like protein